MLQLLKPVEKINELASTVARGLARGEHLLTLLHRTPDVQEKPGAIEIGRANGLLTFEKISFAYAFFMDSEINLKADCTGAGGLSYGAEVELEADADQQSADNADETFLFVTDAFGRIELGRNVGAEDAMALGADTIAAGTGGIDGDTANLGESEITGSDDVEIGLALVGSFGGSEQSGVDDVSAVALGGTLGIDDLPLIARLADCSGAP